MSVWHQGNSLEQSRTILFWALLTMSMLMDESSNVNCLSRSICGLYVNSYLWNDLNLLPCFLDTLKVLNF